MFSRSNLVLLTENYRDYTGHSHAAGEYYHAHSGVEGLSQPPVNQQHNSAAHAGKEKAGTHVLLRHLRAYYLYRQRNILDNLENTGYCKPGKEGLYNVYIMDETHTILACGAGGVSKLRDPHGDDIKRLFNFKYPYEYISRFEEILQRKDETLAFYQSHPIDGTKS